MGQATLTNILHDAKAEKYFSIMVDETTDISCKEQMSICIRYVDADLVPKEVFLGVVECSKTDAATLEQTIETSLMALGLDLKYCRG